MGCFGEDTAQQAQPQDNPLAKILANQQGWQSGDALTQGMVTGLYQKAIQDILKMPGTAWQGQAQGAMPQPKQRPGPMAFNNQVLPPGGGSAGRRIGMGNFVNNMQNIVQTVGKNIEQKKQQEFAVKFNRFSTAIQGIQTAQVILNDPNASPEQKAQAQQAFQQNSDIAHSMTDPSNKANGKFVKQLQSAMGVNFAGEDKNASKMERKVYLNSLQQKQQQATANPQQALQQQQQRQVQPNNAMGLQQGGQRPPDRIQSYMSQIPQQLIGNPQVAAALGNLKGVLDAGGRELLTNEGKAFVEEFKQANENLRTIATEQGLELRADQKAYNDLVQHFLDKKADYDRAIQVATIRTTGAHQDMREYTTIMDKLFGGAKAEYEVSNDIYTALQGKFKYERDAQGNVTKVTEESGIITRLQEASTQAKARGDNATAMELSKQIEQYTKAADLMQKNIARLGGKISSMANNSSIDPTMRMQVSHFITNTMSHQGGGLPNAGQNSTNNRTESGTSGPASGGLAGFTRAFSQLIATDPFNPLASGNSPESDDEPEDDGK